jgi:PKD repeat protein
MFLLLLLLVIFFGTPVTAYTTEVTVTKLAVDNLTVLDKRIVSYQWMRDNLPVLGDGTTHYYLQGPVFVNDPTNETHEQELRWNPEEDANCYPDKDFGALRGTNVMALCNLVGGMSPGEEVKVLSSDGWNMKFAYTNVYTPPERTGPMVVAWEKNGQYPDTGYSDGMRLVWLADTSVNPWGQHVFGNFDWHESAAPQYWYYYTSSGETYPTTTGLSGQIVSDLIIYSKNPVPSPSADFSANIKTGHIVNGNFETSLLNPWTGNSGTTIHIGSVTYRKGIASIKLAATVGNPAMLQQNVDLTNVGSINIWRYQFGGPGKYLEILLDDTVIGNFSETATVANKYETIDLSSYGLSGTHILKFKAVSATSGTFTVYLDDIEDYSPGTSGNAPLTIQFKDLSTKMEDPAHTSWAWDFQNDGSTDSTERNPVYTYTEDGTYTVKLTATNAGGSNTEIKTGYITVGAVTPPPVTGFSAEVTSGIEPLTVQFTDESTNSPSSWRWAYKNETIGWTEFATTQNPEYTFPAGTYDINLTATNAAGSDDEIKMGYIIVTSTAPTIDIDTTGGITNWQFVSGINEDTASVDLSVTTSGTSWQISIKDALDDGKPAGTGGKMSEYTGSAYVTSGYHALTNPLQVKSGTGSYVPLSGSDQVIQTGSSSGTYSYEIGMLQEISAGDAVLTPPNVYRLMITFTGATN